MYAQHKRLVGVACVLKTLSFQVPRQRLSLKCLLRSVFGPAGSTVVVVVVVATGDTNVVDFCDDYGGALNRCLRWWPGLDNCRLHLSLPIRAELLELVVNGATRGTVVATLRSHTHVPHTHTYIHTWGCVRVAQCADLGSSHRCSLQ
jgi:hypothetical protein